MWPMAEQSREHGTYMEVLIEIHTIPSFLVACARPQKT